MSVLALVNLGCGTKAAPGDDVLNVDWSLYVRIRNNKLLGFVTRPFLSEDRRKHLASIPENVTAHNLVKGIPLPTRSTLAVYSSHVLEHIDRNAVKAFLAEIHRVLVPGGIHRVAVPDLELLVAKYTDSLTANSGDVDLPAHEAAIVDLYEQSVRRQAFGAGLQRTHVRFIENLILGDARRRGETHQWMYDVHSLGALLASSGFTSIARKTYNDSDIPNWAQYGLETTAGLEYKPGSLYMECVKPG